MRDWAAANGFAVAMEYIEAGCMKSCLAVPILASITSIKPIIKINPLNPNQGVLFY